MEMSEGSITPGAELTARIEALQQALKERGMDGALILQNADLFYFTGTVQQGQLFVPAEGTPLFMVRKSLERARAESALKRVVPCPSPRKIPELLRESGHSLPALLGMELDVLPANLYFVFRKLFPNARIFDISPEIRLIRAVKSAYETERLRRAARRSDQLIELVPPLIKEGMTELDLAGKVEAEARRMGHQGVVRMRLWGGELFYGHLMAGPGAAEPSFLASPTGGRGASPAVAQGAGRSPIRRWEPILVDYTFALDGYISDMTRIFAIGGLPEELVQGYEAMISIQEAVKKAARPGVPSGDVYKTALDLAVELGYADHFMGHGPDRIRFVGHGVGLELDEFPFLAAGQELPLKAGMTLALEPKLILPGKGVVGIENTHLVGEDGLEPLTRFQEEIVLI